MFKTKEINEHKQMRNSINKYIHKTTEINEHKQMRTSINKQIHSHMNALLFTNEYTVIHKNIILCLQIMERKTKHFHEL